MGELADIVYPAARNRTELLQEFRDGKLDGVVAVYRTFASAALTGLLDEEFVKALPDSTRYLAHCGMPNQFKEWSAYTEQRPFR